MYKFDLGDEMIFLPRKILENKKLTTVFMLAFILTNSFEDSDVRFDVGRCCASVLLDPNEVKQRWPTGDTQQVE